MGSTLDFSPLFRSTVGFDRLMKILDSTAPVDEATLGYPPYNIEKIDDHAYRVTMAVAGFGEDDLHIETRENTLVVSGRPDATSGEHTWLHRGIAARSFRRSFQLADYVKATGARLENGLLHVDLVREVPEAMKPRRIEIATSAAKRIDAKNKQRVERKKLAA